MLDIEKTTTEQLRDTLLYNLTKYWKNIAINELEWEGFPENTDKDLLSSEIIENWLYEEGNSVFFKDANLGFLCLKVHKNGHNVVGKPTQYVAYGNGYTKTLSPDDCVLIKNNAVEMATSEALLYYINAIVDIELTKRLRRNAHKTPFMLETSQETELSAKNTFKKINASEPAIYKNKIKGDADFGVNVLNTDVAYINDKLNDEKNSYVAEILTLLGIDNYVEDKAERVQSAEVEAQKEYIRQSFETMLECRRKACEEINKKFGLNLSVRSVKDKIAEDFDDTDNEPTNEPEEEQEGENE